MSFDQSHKFKKDLPRIKFPGPRAARKVSDNWARHAAKCTGSLRFARICSRISLFSLAQAATPTDFPYRSMVPPILSDITEFLGTYFWLYLFSAVSEAFFDPCRFWPNEASFHSWHKDWIENVFIFRQSQFLLLSASVLYAARRYARCTRLQLC